MPKDTTLTPMMAQYRKTKSELPADVLLLFRMGDFYEMFFDDAVEGSRLMDITLTKRSGVPMAGIPYHALQNYLPKVLEANVKVAIAEQMEGAIKIFRMDCLENPSLAKDLGVEDVPTTLLFHDSTEIARWTGPYSHERIVHDLRCRIFGKEK